MHSHLESRSKLDLWFRITSSGTTWRREIAAGVTTFLTLAYILFLNPAVLGEAIRIDGVDLGPQLLTATALSGAIGSFLMGVIARYPVAAAPAMGLNAYFAFTVVVADGVPWRTALGAVFVSGIVCAILSFSVLREVTLRAFPKPLRMATIAGIGLFLATLGLESAGFLERGQSWHPVLGDPFQLKTLLAAGGLALLLAMRRFNVKGGMMIAIAAVSAVAILSGAPVFNGHAFDGLPAAPVQLPVWPKDLFLQMDVTGVFTHGLIGVVAAFAFVDLFDTIGAIMGLANRAGMMDRDGHVPRTGLVLFADAASSIIGALFGMSPTTTFVESAAGIDAGGRTGVTGLVVGVLFLASLFLWPLAGAIPAVATAPILVFLGATMFWGCAQAIEWDEPAVALPAAVVCVAMPAAQSIAVGIAAGVCAWAVAHVLAAKLRDVHPLLGTAAGLLIGRFVYQLAGL